MKPTNQIVNAFVVALSEEKAPELKDLIFESLNRSASVTLEGMAEANALNLETDLDLSVDTYYIYEPAGDELEEDDYIEGPFKDRMEAQFTLESDFDADAFIVNGEQLKHLISVNEDVKMTVEIMDLDKEELEEGFAKKTGGRRKVRKSFIRKGKVIRRRFGTEKKGFKTVGGKVTKMKQGEINKRKIGARRGALKSRGKQAVSQRKRARSTRRRSALRLR